MEEDWKLDSILLFGTDDNEDEETFEEEMEEEEVELGPYV